MPHVKRALKLDKNWDVCLDQSGRIAIVTGNEATAQNVANECRLFTDDAYFIQDQGIPHFDTGLGQRLMESLLRSCLRKAALKVKDVREVLNIEIHEFDQETRKLSVSLEFTSGDSDGAIRIDI